ncbi:uncharacterized protein LOC135369129 [Ornithodoros turicata]|uniref:uncharacterized protein LOC135369129 n=1 Tax=Ornithodoros turicata TaxID=34597 RepID=UPI0031392AC5
MEKLRRNRAVLRGAVTRCLSSATELLQQPSAAPSDLQVTLDELLDKDRTLTALNDKVAELIDDDTYEQEISTALDYHEKICRCGFWEHFEATIHRRPDLPDIEKFQYLKTYLSGSARRAVEWIRLNETNYPVAVSVLTERFGRTDALVDEHIDSLLAIAPISCSSQITRLRDLYEQIQFRTSCLESLGVPAAEYAVVLHRVLMRSLPEDIAVLYRQRLKTQDKQDAPSSSAAGSRAEEVNTAMEFLRVQVESREETKAARVKENSNLASTERVHSRSSSHLPTALALATGSAPPDQLTCPLCDQSGHTTQECHASLSTDEKRRRLSARRCCFKCGKRGHMARQCRTAATLRCRACSSRHLTVLCDLWKRPDARCLQPSSALGASNSQSTSGPQSPQHATATVAATHTSSGVGHPILLQTATVWASEEGGYVLLQPEARLFPRVNETSHESKRLFPRVKLTLSSRFTSNAVTLEALEVPEVCTVTTTLATDLPELSGKNLLFADEPNSCTRENSVISVLIGSDFYWSVVTGRTERLGDRMCAVETMFGWVVQGVNSSSSLPAPMCGNTVALFLGYFNIACGDEKVIDPSEMWRLDAIGITDSAHSQATEERTAFDQFQSAVYKEEGRYVVPLMVKAPYLLSTTNRPVAEARLQRQLKRFEAHPDVLREYDRTISEYFNEGHAERVEPSDQGARHVYYLPHHAVIRREAVTTKVRVVFDASSHEPGSHSLNDMLDKGTTLGAELLQLLLQFRCNHIVMTADIRKAFLQIHVRREDRDLLRFLWIERLPSSDDPCPTIVEWRMTRVPFGASSSPFLLSATLMHHLESWKTIHPEIASRLQRAFYVDDLVIGASTEPEALHIYQTARAIVADASMELRKWCSSSETLNEQFRADGVSLDDIGQPFVRCKVLGLPWNRSADTIVMTTQNVSSYVATQPATKRVVLQTFARLFDPLGLLGPFLVRAKLLFQELWRRNCTWEEALPEDVHEHWKTWTSELSELSSFEVPRCVISPATQGAKGQELHVFCDASPMAYGVAVYVRCVMSENSFASQLLMSKGRIAPLRPVSIPRLELLACLLAARLCHYVRQLPELSQAVVHLWTDSAVALHWICGDAVRQEVFVRNRSSEIRRLTRGFHWHHCRSQDNPADLLTRGEPASFVSRKTIWWAGPAWLTNPQVDWPTDLCPSQKHDDLRTGLTSACQSLSLPTSPHLHDPLLRINDYGRLTKVLRVTAWIKRFLRNASLHTTSSSGPLTAAELCEAELYWIRFVQRSAFPSEVATLEVGQSVESASSILTLQPFLDKKGLLRVGGRLQALDASEELKHPMILPCNDRFTELLVEAAHIRLLHGGVQLTLIELRSRFWILKGRRTVRRVLNACLPCRRRRLRPETAPPAPLPRDRITETMPFDVVGIDFCGPLYCRASQNTDRKVYIVVFSCAVTRAIHLELTIDMTAQTFLLAVRRFASRRGVPSTIYSDNAKTFRYCAKVLRALFDDSVQDHASSLRIQWKFIAEGAPWWGGFWERLIRTIKDALKRCLGRSSLCYEGLLTVLLEVEAAVNCRPLTQLADDTEDCEALTPSHFLIGRRAVALPASLGLEVPSSTPAGLRRRVRHRQALLVQLWTRWKKDYLLLLRSAHHSQPRAHPRIRVGDVVIVEDNALPPLVWKLGRIVGSFPGRDGVERCFKVLLPNGQQLRRPPQRLYLLEADSSNAAAGGC